MTMTVASILALIQATGTYTPAQVQAWAADAALEYRLPALLWLKQVKQESSFIFDLVNRKSKCYGPAQLNPRFYPPDISIMIGSDLFPHAHPRGNLYKGASLMRKYLDLGKGEAYALSCYNYGPTATAENWPRIPDETKKYIRIILGEEFVPKEETMPSKLGPHFQAIPNWAPGLWSELAAKLARPLYAKIVIPPEQNLFHPNIRIIGRAYIGDGDSTEQVYINQAVTDGAAKRAAGDYLDACWPQYSRAPYVYAWEGPNEPPVQTIQQCHRLNRFLYHWSILMHNRGKRTIGGSISVGRPEGKTDILDLKDAVRACDDWSVHEYGAPTMQTGQGSYCLRYRTHILEPLASVGITPSLYITETGIDGGVIDQAHARQGWKRFCSEDQYLVQLQWYDSEIRKDAAVVAAFPFTSGPQGWDSFDVGESLSRKVAAYILTMEQAPAPLPQPTHDVQLVQRIREVACANIGRPVPYNPDAALAKFARANSLGAPLTPEFDMVGHRGQGYAMGIVYCLIGQWDKCEVMPW